MTSAIPNDWQLPEYRVSFARERRSTYAVVIPVINEGCRIGRQLQAMHALGLTREFETILADGGSTDGSTAHDLLTGYGVNALLVKTGPGRLSAQLRMAYGWAMERGYDGVITIDGNGKDSVENIRDFAAALDDGVDYAQASRFIKGGQSDNAPLSRIVAIRFCHAPIISLAAGTWLTDTTQGFRAYSRRYLLDERVQPFRDVFNTYELLAYLSVRASQISLTVREIPTCRSYPRGEKTPTKIKGFKGQMELLRILAKTVLRHYHPKPNVRT